MGRSKVKRSGFKRVPPSTWNGFWPVPETHLDRSDAYTHRGNRSPRLSPRLRRWIRPSNRRVRSVPSHEAGRRALTDPLSSWTDQRPPGRTGRSHPVGPRRLWGSLDHPVDARPSDPELLRDRGGALPFPHQRPHGLRIDRTRTLVDSGRFRLGDAFRLALAPQVRLELGEHAQHIEEGFAGGGRRVDRLLGRKQAGPLPSQLAHDVLEVADRARQPVDAGDHQRVALADEGEHRAQLVAADGRGSGHLLGPDDVAAGGLQGGELHGEVLVEGTDARVADPGH